MTPPHQPPVCCCDPSPSLGVPGSTPLTPRHIRVHPQLLSLRLAPGRGRGRQRPLRGFSSTVTPGVAARRGHASSATISGLGSPGGAGHFWHHGDPGWISSYRFNAAWQASVNCDLKVTVMVRVQQSSDDLRRGRATAGGITVTLVDDSHFKRGSTFNHDPGLNLSASVKATVTVTVISESACQSLAR